RDDRIGRIAVDLAAAAGGEHRRVGNDLHRFAGDAGAHAVARAATNDEIEHARFFENSNALRLAHASDEGPRHFGARLVPVRVYDAIFRVRRLAPERQATLGIE